MGILRTDRVSGLGGANAIKGSVYYKGKSFIKVEPDSSFTLGTGDYTVESWVYSERSYGGIFQLFDSNIMDGSNDSGPGFGAVISDGEWNTYYGSGSIADSGVDLERSVWQHVALVRYSGTTKIYINGTSIVSQSDSTNYTSSMIFPVIGGWWNNDYNWQGYMSNFRFVVGTAVYQSNFTPPTSELTAIDGTQILCFQTSDILREETGKTLVIDGESNNNAPIASRFTPNSPVGFSTTTDVGTQFGTTFDGVTTFDSQAYFVPPGGNTRERNRGRALFGGGSTIDNTIQSLNIQSQGNAEDFGDLSTGRYETECAASSTRGIWAGGYTESPNVKVNIIEFVTITNSSNTTDFGDLTLNRGHTSGASNATRGIIAGGTSGSSPHPVTNVIDFFTIATAGNASDFGDITTARKFMGGGRSSTTRALFCGGNDPETNAIDFVTIATTGNAQDFGDCTQPGWSKGAGNVSSGTRAVLAGGFASPTNINVIEFLTIATLGNGTDFGDLAVATRATYAAGSKTRGIFGGGKQNPANATTNTISFVTIATTGNAQDFGNMINSKSFASGLSDCHGGLE